MKLGTKTVHAGVKPDPTTGAIMTPIYQTSTYVQAAPGDHKGYEYARTQNPTRTALEESLSTLENGKHAICYASGMAGVDAIMKLLRPGDEVISTNDLYGGSYRIFQQVFAPYGIQFHFTDLTNIDHLLSLINEKTRMIWIETPTNPLMSIIDIGAVSEIAKEKGIWTVVDNTFSSPVLQRPLEMGADIVLHSITKFINGHSDVVMGAAILNDDEIGAKLRFQQNASGAVPGPMDCFLTLRGIKTLELRMKRHSENGEKVAHFLLAHPKVEKVYWPGFKHHANYEVAKKQMSMFGGMLSFTLKDDSMEAALKVLKGTEIFALAESLGGVESLIGHPASMTHASIPREERMKSGLVDTLIRLSVGIEDGEDLVNDLAKALRY